MLIADARESKVEGSGDDSLAIEACIAESVASAGRGSVSEHLFRFAGKGLVELQENAFDDTDKEGSV